MQNANRIYLDYNATTPLHPRAQEAMSKTAREVWGNPSSVYAEGRLARALVEDAREKVAKLLGASPPMVVFTSCGSESNGWVLSSAVGRGMLATTTVEHPSVLQNAQAERDSGREVRFIAVDRQGRLPEEPLKGLRLEAGDLLSLMHANNETGVVFDVAGLARQAHQHGLLVHTDASQTVGKETVDFEALGVDFLTLSAHKFYGPKGVGALLVKDPSTVQPLGRGGGQERGLRPGTENVTGIVGLATALEECLSNDFPQRVESVARLRDHLEQRLLEEIDGLHINGCRKSRLANTTNVRFTCCDGQALLMALDLQGISCSAGSACHSGSMSPSAVLLAMGLSEQEANTSLRFSLGYPTKRDEVDRGVEIIKQVIRRLRLGN